MKFPKFISTVMWQIYLLKQCIFSNNSFLNNNFCGCEANEAGNKAHANIKPVNCKKLCQIPFIHLQNKSHLLYCFFFFNFLLIYFWLHWVFVAACRLSLVAASWGYSSLQCVGFSLHWLLLLRSMGSRRMGFSSGTRAQQL